MIAKTVAAGQSEASDARAAGLLDPYDEGNVGDPFPAYARLRSEAPVHHVVERDLWALSRFEDVSAALDPLSFSSAETNGRAPRRVAVVAGTDAPEHTRLRRPAAAQFTARKLAAWPERIRALVGERIELIAGGDRDFVKLVSEPVACELISRIIGAPPNAIAALRRGRGLALSPRHALSSFFTELVASRRHVPGDDLVSGLLADGELTTAEIVNFCTLLLAAGIDTTRDLLSNAVIELAEHPDQWERLAAEPLLIDSAVDEVIRFTSPIQAMFRTATADVDLPGGRVPAGARVMLLFGSANRDERRWSDAAAFDVARYAPGASKGPHHLGLGAGSHACLGAWLARQTGAAALTELLRRGGPPRVLRPAVRGHNPCFRSVVSLTVALG
jgi:cytochrome P450